MLFCIIIYIGLFFSLLIIFIEGPFISLLALVQVIIVSCFLLSVLGVSFLVYIYLLVYIGVIVVLFLFVLSLLQCNYMAFKSNKQSSNIIDNLLYSFFIYKVGYFFYYFILLFCYFFKKVIREYNYSWSYYYTNHSLVIGDSLIFCTLFENNFFFLIIVGFILLFSMVGSIALCFRFDI